MRSRQPRTGSLSFWLLFSMPVLLMLGFVGINALWMDFARGQTETVVDSSSLAASLSMVDDSMLVGDAVSLANLQDVAKVQAQFYSNFHPLPQLPLTYDDVNDFAFNEIDHPLNNTLKIIDSLELTGNRTAANNFAVPLFGQGLFSLGAVDVVAKSKVKFDREVAGFRPVFFNNIPLAPIAIAQTDMTAGWKDAIEDSWAATPPANIAAFPTLTVTLGNTGMYDPYVLNLCMACDPAAETLNGVGPGDLSDFGGELIVPNGGDLPIPGTQTAPAGLAAALQTLQTNGTKRAFPLYEGVDGMGQPKVVRFVAAKVTNVVDNGTTIDLTLTPAFLEHPSVVTEFGRTTNPYLARVRLYYP